MKFISALVLTVLSFSATADTEDNLKIIEVGAWSSGNSILYIRFDRAVGPSSCTNALAKVYLGENSSSQKELMAMATIRSLALTALTAKLNVKINTLDTCVHNSPSISQLYLKN